MIPISEAECEWFSFPKLNANGSYLQPRYLGCASANPWQVQILRLAAPVAILASVKIRCCRVYGNPV